MASWGLSANIPVCPELFKNWSVFNSSSFNWLPLAKEDKAWVASIIVWRASLFLPIKSSITCFWIPVNSDKRTGVFNLNTSSADELPTKKSGTLKTGSPLSANLKPLSKLIFLGLTIDLIVCSNCALLNDLPGLASWYNFCKPALPLAIASALIL